MFRKELSEMLATLGHPCKDATVYSCVNAPGAKGSFEMYSFGLEVQSCFTCDSVNCKYFSEVA